MSLVSDVDQSLGYYVILKNVFINIQEVTGLKNRLSFNIFKYLILIQMIRFGHIITILTVPYKHSNAGMFTFIFKIIKIFKYNCTYLKHNWYL